MCTHTNTSHWPTDTTQPGNYWTGTPIIQHTSTAHGIDMSSTRHIQTPLFPEEGIKEHVETSNSRNNWRNRDPNKLCRVHEWVCSDVIRWISMFLMHLEECCVVADNKQRNTNALLYIIYCNIMYRIKVSGLYGYILFQFMLQFNIHIHNNV